MNTDNKIREVANGNIAGLFVLSNVELTNICKDLLESKDIKAQRDELLSELIETHAGLCFTEGYIGSLRHKRNAAVIAKCEAQS